MYSLPTIASVTQIIILHIEKKRHKKWKGIDLFSPCLCWELWLSFCTKFVGRRKIRIRWSLLLWRAYRQVVRIFWVRVAQTDHQPSIIFIRLLFFIFFCIKVDLIFGKTEKYSFYLRLKWTPTFRHFFSGAPPASKFAQVTSGGGGGGWGGGGGGPNTFFFRFQGGGARAGCAPPPPPLNPPLHIAIE